VKHLVDANVLSEATEPDPDPNVVEWLRRNELEQWFERGVGRIQCLPWDSAVGLRWAQLLADPRRRGRPMSIKDSLMPPAPLPTIWRSSR
jgi:predicted nucleic acid-binding protein